MSLLNQRSLAGTVDAVSEKLFFGETILAADRTAVAKWIAGRQGLSGSYANMYAPTKRDMGQGMRLFTGELLSTQVSAMHILGEECCRLLALLQVKDRHVQEAQQAALAGITARLNDAEARGCGIGMYCCGKCSCAYWRNLVVNRIPRREERLAEGMKALAQSRTGDTKWRRFPFYYTCLVLTEIGTKEAKAEMHYAAPFWEKNLKQLASSKECYARRRFAIGERLLAMC